MVGAISAATDRKPDFVVGKPNPYILNKIAEDFNIESNQIVVVGDSYESDIQMALNNRNNAILINKNYVNLSDNVLVLKDLNELLDYIERKE